MELNVSTPEKHGFPQEIIVYDTKKNWKAFGNCYTLKIFFIFQNTKAKGKKSLLICVKI